MFIEFQCFPFCKKTINVLNQFQYVSLCVLFCCFKKFPLLDLMILTDVLFGVSLP